jgi:hypothetical protein
MPTSDSMMLPATLSLIAPITGLTQLPVPHLSHALLIKSCCALCTSLCYCSPAPACCPCQPTTMITHHFCCCSTMPEHHHCQHANTPAHCLCHCTSSPAHCLGCLWGGPPSSPTLPLLGLYLYNLSLVDHRTKQGTTANLTSDTASRRK